MRQWSPPPTRLTSPRHNDCMAAFFIIMGAIVFAAALLCAFGVINLLG